MAMNGVGRSTVNVISDHAKTLCLGHMYFPLGLIWLMFYINRAFEYKLFSNLNNFPRSNVNVIAEL